MSISTENTNKTLSIRISTDGFCFCSYLATEPDSLQYYYHEADSNISLTANFNEAWNACTFATVERYSEIRVIVATADFTTIPAEYDNKAGYESIYRSCFPQTAPGTQIIANSLTAQGVTVLFAIDSELYKRVLEAGDITFYTPASILLGYIASQSIEQERYLLAYLHKGKSLLLSIDEGRLMLSNSFKSENPYDQTYYLLSIWQEQGFCQNEDTLYLCGDKSVEELSPVLKQFIRNCKRVNPLEQFRPTILNKIKDTPFDLQALLLCE